MFGSCNGTLYIYGQLSFARRLAGKEREKREERGCIRYRNGEHDQIGLVLASSREYDSFDRKV
jgi:hypothetical protein